MIRQVTSPDGTQVSYETLGSGPGLLVIHGSLMAPRDYRRLAEALSSSFTVYLIERRGRGLSGPQGAGYDIRKEVEDATSILKHHNIPYVFGHSYGGLIALNLGLAQPLEKLVVYEPAIYPEGTPDQPWLAQLEGQVTEGRQTESVITLIRGLSLAGILSQAPRSLMRPLVRLMLRTADWQERLPLVGAIPGEERAGMAIAGTKRYRTLAIPTLLLSGTRTEQFFSEGARALAQELPQAEWRRLAGLRHRAPDSERPEHVAETITNWIQHA